VVPRGGGWGSGDRARGGRLAATHPVHAALAALALAVASPRPAAAAPAADSIRYVAKIASINRAGLNETNYGFFGNNFASRSPSFEFPLGSGFEHMSRAGLWVGAVALADTGLFTGVSTAIVDNNQNTAEQNETEFTPAGNQIVERSRIANNSSFSRDAISDQDLSCSYSDQPARDPRGLQTERHTPLNVLVRQSTLGFSLPAAEDFVVLRFKVLNQGPPLTNVYLGFFAQLASGNKHAYSGWPPGASSGPGSWYYKAYSEYDTTRRLYKEHYCFTAPYPGGCNLDSVPPWASVKLLKVSPGSIADRTVSFNWWNHDLGDSTRVTDVQKYALMSNGQIMDPRECTPGGSNCSPISVLSVGPFAQVNHGDSVAVDFALIGGDDEADLLTNADFAQFAADIDYRLPAPPPSPRLRVATGRQRVDLFWDDSPESVPDTTSQAPGGIDFEGYRVYLGRDRQHPTRVAQFDATVPPHDTTGFNTSFSVVRHDTIIDGRPYHYRYAVTGLKDGFTYYGGVTSFDLGDSRVASLESGLGQNKFQAVPLAAPGEASGDPIVFPNPYRVEAAWDRSAQVRDHYLWFARLPRRCTLRIYTLSGDRVFETRFDGDAYRGAGTRGLYDPAQDLDTGAPALSGASFAWNLITSHGQALATGLYVYSVEDAESGRVARGKFLVVKSDREGP
jgi:hypothetical protein